MLIEFRAADAALEIARILRHVAAGAEEVLNLRGGIDVVGPGKSDLSCEPMEISGLQRSLQRVVIRPTRELMVLICRRSG